MFEHNVDVDEHFVSYGSDAAGKLNSDDIRTVLDEVCAQGRAARYEQPPLR